MEVDNPFDEASFTTTELDVLDGIAIGSLIKWRGEFHLVQSVRPLSVKVLWPRNNIGILI